MTPSLTRPSYVFLKFYIRYKKHLFGENQRIEKPIEDNTVYYMHRTTDVYLI